MRPNVALCLLLFIGLLSEAKFVLSSGVFTSGSKGGQLSPHPGMQAGREELGGRVNDGPQVEYPGGAPALVHSGH